MYHHEKTKRTQAEKKAKIEAENAIKEQKSRAQIVRERIKKFTKENQRKLFLRAEKPIAKKKAKLAKAKSSSSADQEKAKKVSSVQQGS
mmetsp:Transcript_23397/g.29057  ORF Transcript_23397/g.29057 Transcript_23397/m.29057 type:complete len:89 (-) Transcript_23397:163-429(-)